MYGNPLFYNIKLKKNNNINKKRKKMKGDPFPLPP